MSLLQEIAGALLFCMAMAFLAYVGNTIKEIRERVERIEKLVSDLPERN